MSTVIVPSTEVEVPKKQLMRMHQREEMRGEIEGMKEMLPNLKSAQDRGSVAQRAKRLEQSLIQQSPDPNIPGSAKDKLAKRVKQLEEKFTQGMLSQEEMRKNPAGSVGQHMRWEKANKKDILEWKNAKIMLEPESNDPDLANIETLRPNGAMDRMRVDAQIPGKMSYLSVPQENWDEAFQGKGPQNSALQQAQRRKKEEKD